MISQISGSSTVVAARDQVSSDLAGEAAILDMKSGIYYGLNAVGARIWNLIQEPKTVDEVAAAILAEYDVETDRCQHDIVALLQDLVAHGLVEIVMERPHKFHRPPVRSRHLRLKSLLLLGLVRVGLWLLPFRTLRRLLAHMMPAHAAAHEGNQASIRHIVWAVTVASRYVPAATCLTQALATQVLLRRCGYAADLRIGVARSEAGVFQAHAWVECQGEVVIGGVQAPSRFTPLPALDGERP